MAVLALSWTAMARGADVERLDPEALARRLTLPDPPLVLDARSRDDYRTATIIGAVSAGREPDGFLPSRDGAAIVLVLPADADADLVARWADRLSGHPVTILDGGLDAWRAQGLPLEAPEETYAVPGQVPFTIPRGICEMGAPAQVYD